jgi:hypothetical protein
MMSYFMSKGVKKRLTSFRSICPICHKEVMVGEKCVSSGNCGNQSIRHIECFERCLI